MKINRNGLIRLMLLMLLALVMATTSCAAAEEKRPESEQGSEAGESERAETSEEVGGSGEESFPEESFPTGSALLTVHFLDVGQGDSVFIELPDGKTMLIDAGEKEQGEIVEAYIRKLGYRNLDYVIATHPHTDHIGGMKKILQSFSVGKVCMPDVSAGTSTYINLAEYILDKGIPVCKAEAGVKLIAEETYTAEFLGPARIIEEDLNNDSAVLLLTFGDKRFLFMGDAGTEEEKTLGRLPECDVLKVGHHGSRTSTGETLLLETKPDFAIISCGEGNDYGHPHKETMEKLRAAGTNVFRTDVSGTIVVETDGKTLNVQTQKSEEQREESGEESGKDTEEKDWILNTSSKKIHCPDCKNAKTISEKNKKEVHCSLAELYAQGYTDCASCRPSGQ